MNITKLNPNDFTKEELLEKASALGIKNYPLAKNALMPTKKEIVNTIFEHELAQVDDPLEAASIREAIAKSGSVEELQKTVESLEEKFKHLPNNVKRRILKDIYINSRVRVLITENPNSLIQEKENNSLNEQASGTVIHFKTWGDDFIGHQRNRVIYGSPYHIPYGLLISLLNSTSYRMVKNPQSNTYETVEEKKFNISVLAPLTTSELETIAKNQKFVNAQQLVKNY